MKWLLTLNSTCVNSFADDMKKIIPTMPQIRMYDHFPVVEVYLTDVEIKLVSAIPCVLSHESQIKFKIHEVESPTSWVLDSLDSEKLDDQYHFTRTGKGVNVYVVDSGIEANHRDFDNRADMNSLVTETQPDCTGHGSHVAGLVGGRNVGVAKRANIHSIKVITCADDSDNFVIVNAFNTIISDVKSKNYSSALVNLSLGPHADSNGNFPVSDRK